MYMYNRYACTNSWLFEEKKIQIEILYTCTKKQLAMLAYTIMYAITS